MTEKNKHRLSPKDLKIQINRSWLSFQTTAKLSAHEGMIGQSRAMKAVEQGLKISTRGFNIFAVGEAGSGKTSTLKRLLRERAADEKLPDDLLYVHNFDDPEKPLALALHAGRGRVLAKDMERVVQELERMIPRALSDGAFGHIRASIMAETRSKAEDLLRKAARAAERLDLQLQEGEDEDSLRVIPLVKGEPLEEEEYLSLSRAQRQQIENNLIGFQEHMDSYGYARRQLEREHNKHILDAEVRAITPLVEELLGEVAKSYKKDAHVLEYLDNVKEHTLSTHRDFLPREAPAGRADENSAVAAAIEAELGQMVRIAYQVNVVVDRTSQKGAPVIEERMPSQGNLIGCFEYRETHGGLATDHMMIRAGALHQANGGYLLLQAHDLLTHEHAWEALKRALRHKEIRVEEGMGSSEGRPRLAGMLKPTSVPLNVKVILVGNHDTYYLLKLEDEDFSRLFKIKADFAQSMILNKFNFQQLVRFMGQVCREEGYLPLHKTGVERLVEFASRKAGHQRKLTTRRAGLLDLVAEANLFAREKHSRAIHAEDVTLALAAVDERHASFSDALVREINDDTIIIKTKGKAIGQINGIALYDLAGIRCGLPVRITARVYAGKRGVVNIDREVHLSGSIHDKGALILIGYLGGQYAQEQTLGLSASVTFEQSYDEIDGDSASCSELYALLSALSGCPINQGIAVTGSVNQLGEVQPIGGVNEKIEGIFRVCNTRSHSGEQGVMIPKANVKNLNLHDDVIDAVKKGKFHIYAVSHVDEGIEVLTGVPAGRRLKSGWTPDSINDRVQQRLLKLSDTIRETGVMTAFDRSL